MRILFQPAKNLISPTLYGISDLFPSVMTVVNQEMNCYSEGTSINIVAIDTVANTIEVNFIPDNMPIPITEPIVGKEWILAIPIGLYGKDFEYIKITGGNSATRVLNYETNIQSPITKFIPGARLIYYNQFNNEWTLSNKIAPVVGSYYSQMQGPGGVWKHSDGTFRMAVNGYNGTNWQVGLFSSVDLTSWVPVSTAAKITYNPADWRMDGIHVSGVIKHPTENKYFGVCYGQSNAGYFRVGWVKFDENMENIEYSPNEILDTAGTYSGIYIPSIIYFNGKYRLYACKRNSNNQAYWTMCEYSADIPEGPYTFERIAIESSSDAIQLTKTVYRGYSTMMFPFIVNSELFAIVDGTGNYDESGNAGNRQFGLFKYDKNTNSWDDVRNGLVLSNFFFGSNVYGNQNSVSGHSGGSPIIFFNDGMAYFFAAYTNITDDYKTFSLKKRLYFPELQKAIAGVILSPTPTVSAQLSFTTGTSLKVGLLSVWEFNEEEGAVAVDSFGTKNYNHNMVINQEGKIGKCYRSDTGTKYIVGTNSDFDFGLNQDFTISMWVKLTSYLNAPYIIGKRISGGDGKGYYMYYEDRAGYFDSNNLAKQNSINFVIDSGPTFMQVTSGNNSVPYGSTDWHHVIAYRRGTIMGIKINGGAANEYSNDAVATSLSSTSSIFAIFRNNGTGGTPGYLDQTAIWNRALSESEMNQVYNSNTGLAFTEW